MYSTAGTWDPRTRKLVMSSFDVRTRGFDGTSSVQKNGTWTVSGASVYNQYLFLGAYYEIYYNEVGWLTWPSLDSYPFEEGWLCLTMVTPIVMCLHNMVIPCITTMVCLGTLSWHFHHAIAL